MENSAKPKEKWVGGTAGRGGECKRKIYCVSLMASLNQNGKAGCSQTPSGRQMRAFLSNSRQPTMEEERVPASQHWGHTAAQFLMPPLTQKGHTSQSIEMMLNGLQELWWHEFASWAQRGNMADNHNRGEKKKTQKNEEKNKTPLGGNQNGSRFSHLFAQSSKLRPFLSLLLAAVICSASHLVRRRLCSPWRPATHRRTPSPL